MTVLSSGLTVSSHYMCTFHNKKTAKFHKSCWKLKMPKLYTGLVENTQILDEDSGILRVKTADLRQQFSCRVLDRL